MTEIEEKEIKNILTEIDKSLKELSPKISAVFGKHLNNLKEEQENSLKKKFIIVIVILSLITIIALLFQVYLLLSYKSDNLFAHILLSIFAGITGSCISALLSALQRRANGWAFSDGSKYPGDGPKDKFNERMVLFFLFRPLLGGVVGFIVLMGGISGLFLDIHFGDGFYKLIFLSFLGGLFAKSLLAKLKDTFDFLIGKR